MRSLRPGDRGQPRDERLGQRPPVPGVRPGGAGQDISRFRPDRRLVISLVRRFLLILRLRFLRQLPPLTLGRYSGYPPDDPEQYLLGIGQDLGILVMRTAGRQILLDLWVHIDSPLKLFPVLP